MIKCRYVDVNECPACRGERFSVLGRAPGLVVSVGGCDFWQPDYAIHECPHCGLVYRSPNLAEEDLAAYYELVDYRKWEVPDFYPTERLALKQLRQLPHGSRILDFGCSSGRLLAPLVKHYDCWGFEINRAAARAAADKGLKMMSLSAFNSEASGVFDAIVLSDVFEHLSSPLDLLRTLNGMLKPGGKIVITTGDSDSPACRLDPAQFWYFRTVEHLCMLNRRHADFICKHLGMSLSSWNETSHYDIPIVERVFQYTRHFAYWKFQRGTLLSKTILPLLPFLNPARGWSVAPGYSAGSDHVVAVLQKTGPKTKDTISSERSC